MRERRGDDQSVVHLTEATLTTLTVDAAVAWTQDAWV
jgi:hypothetical protein